MRGERGSRSCGDGEEFGQIRRGFVVFQPVGNDAQSERLHAAHSFLAALAIGKHAGQRWRFGQVAPVVFTFDFDLEFQDTLRWYRPFRMEPCQLAQIVQNTG